MTKTVSHKRVTKGFLEDSEVMNISAVSFLK